MMLFICRLLAGLCAAVSFIATVYAAESVLAQYTVYLPTGDLLLSAAAACAALAMTFFRKP